MNKKSLPIYPILAGGITVIWLIYMFFGQRFGLFGDFWSISLTMLFSSFIGSATPLGGGAVAFPVLTKVLGVDAATSRNFAFMIQAVGMSTAAVVILSRRIPILKQVIVLVTLGGIVGTTFGTIRPIAPPPFPKLLFTLVAIAFAGALVVHRWMMPCPVQKELPPWTNNQRALFLFIGLIGGLLSAVLGSGINLITFIVLTLAFGIDERISTPTTVIIMALNAAFGFFIHGVFVNDLGEAWNFWLVAVPVVIYGAPLGAFCASKVSRDVILYGLIVLTAIEFITTILLIPMDTTMRIFCLVSAVICAVLFTVMLRLRQRRLGGVAG